MTAPEDLLERIRLRLDESFVGIGEVVAELQPADVADLVNQLTRQEAAAVMSMLAVPRAVEVCDQPTLRRRSAILVQMEPGRAAQILEGLSADQRTEIVRGMGEVSRRRLLPKLSAEVRAEVERLLQYPPHSAGGIMTTEFVRLSPSWTVGECLKHVRAVAREKESIYAGYVMEPDTGRLLGSVSLRDLVMAELDQPVERIMRRKPVTVNALDDQEAVAGKIAKYNLLAVPVLEKDGSVVGFVTVDDVVDVMIEEGTEDALKMGAIEAGALDEPYTATPFWSLVRKRAGWLLVLFLSEMLTATAMGRFEEEIARAVVLALFVPLIISSGGNSGSQAASLIIRALAVGELRVRDWWRVMRREIFSGLVLGGILGLVGFVRITAWSLVAPQAYGPHWPLVAVTVWVSLVGVVLWGTLAGSMLPLLLKRAGMDPAVSSAPFVATLVDVTGIVIYFEVAARILRGTLL
ncbi:MAG TPA: magnesium transporter [Vicinamibacteria bacterium]|nr:magnesium transporter [Vicinamibacteria bacterium]